MGSGLPWLCPSHLQGWVRGQVSSLGLEHTKILGDTIDKIAFEKAGIFKPSEPLPPAVGANQIPWVYSYGANRIPWVYSYGANRIPWVYSYGANQIPWVYSYGAKPNPLGI